MNKLIKYTIILCAAIFLYTSCNDEFFERYPLVQMSDASYWNSENDLKLYCNRFYNATWDNYNQMFLPRYEDWSQGLFSEDGLQGSDTQINVAYNQRMNGDVTLPASGGGWDINHWLILRSLNYFMDNYSKVTSGWEPYVGEILFFRTLFYFDRLRRFGDLPYVDAVLFNDSEILFEARMPRNQLVEKLMEDMDLAVRYLPEKTSTWTGRLNKEAAMLLQARIALFEGTWEKYHGLKNTPFAVSGSDGSQFIRKARDVSKALMDLAQSNGQTDLSYEGVPNGYRELFIQKDYSAVKEVIFWRKYEPGISFNRVTGYLASGGGYGLTRRLIDAYLCVDGKPIGVSTLYQGDKDLKTVVTNRDPRMDQTVFVDDGKHIQLPMFGGIFDYPIFWGESVGDKSTTGYMTYKGFDGDVTCTAQGGMTGRSAGTIYYRFAEALLIYAETRAELGEITQGDIDMTINRLRKRGGMPDEAMLNMNDITADPNWEFGAYLSPLLQEIRRERKVELAVEGFRVYDIFRWAAADELIKGYKPQGAVWEQWREAASLSPIFQDGWNDLSVDDEGYIAPYKVYNAVSTTGYNFRLDRDYLLPIPTNELVLNPKLGQNPGW